MAGRNISTTHVALGTTRVMRTTGMMGEVVGMAAWLCTIYGVSPREVYFYHLPELKALMTRGVGKQGLPLTQSFNEGEILENFRDRTGKLFDPAGDVGRSRELSLPEWGASGV